MGTQLNALIGGGVNRGFVVLEPGLLRIGDEHPLGIQQTDIRVPFTGPGCPVVINIGECPVPDLESAGVVGVEAGAILLKQTDIRADD